LKNSKIKDVAVVGLPDEESGQLPLAFVVKNSDVNLSEEQVQDFFGRCGSDESEFSVLVYLYFFLIASGKILRKNLYELLSH
jgi:4-coumarate--CoA ligase